MNHQTTKRVSAIKKLVVRRKPSPRVGYRKPAQKFGYVDRSECTATRYALALIAGETDNPARARYRQQQTLWLRNSAH